MRDDPALLSLYIRGHLTVIYVAVWIRAVTRNDDEPSSLINGSSRCSDDACQGRYNRHLHCWFRREGFQNYWLSIRRDFGNGPTEPTNSIRRLALMGYSLYVHPVGYRRIGAANPQVGGVARQARHESTWSDHLNLSNLFL